MRSSSHNDNEVRIQRPYCGLGRPKISRPLFATLQHSKASPSSSRSPSPSSAPSIAPLTSARLRSLATTLLTALANTHDLDLASTLIAPDAQIQHDDNPVYTTRASFLGAWQGITDERERKVWIRSLVTVCGKLKDGTMVVVFDEEGMCVRSWTQSRFRRKDEWKE
jgi:hypothetical protein